MDTFVAQHLGWIAAFLALAIGYYQHVRTAQLNVFIAFTERYRSIMSILPSEMRGRVFDLPDVSSFLECPKNRATLIDYLNMCAEEHALWTEGLISRRIWRIWEKEMKSALGSPLMRQFWIQASKSYAADLNFVAFVDKVQKSESTTTRTES